MAYAANHTLKKRIKVKGPDMRIFTIIDATLSVNDPNVN